ncbi:amidase domain-containing protein [Lysinibacillus sp. NPDC093688]|uniref:amidase domain-containing protein n=1 Tax=Lysinibacillus sp. NPDC093688 TaxID=3390577 RepID=UPI003D072CB7
MKKLLFSLSLIFVLVFVGSNASQAQAKTPDDYKLVEVQQILLDYFKDNDIEFEVGSKEYNTYLLSQQLDNIDNKLSNNPNYDIIDYYIGEYLYQLDQNQGENTPINSDYWEITIGELKKEIELRNEDEEKFEQELKELQLDEIQLNLSYLAASTYDRTKVANYAKEYATKNNSAYKRYNANCTNFVSQAVYAGGKTQTKPSNITNGILDTTSYWYNNNYYDCTGSNSCYYRDKISTSWIRVTDFYSYWTNKGMSATTSTNKSTIISNANVGDVIQFKSKSGWFHSVIVNRKANGTVYVSSNDDDYYDQDFKNRGNDSESFRVINIK